MANLAAHRSTISIRSISISEPLPTHCARALVNLVVVATRISLVPKEMNGRDMIDEAETIGLIPSDREYIKADLTAFGPGCD